MANFSNIGSLEIYDEQQKKATVLEQSLDVKLYSTLAKQCVFYGCSNTLILCVVIHDIYNKSSCDITTTYILKYLFAVILGFSIVWCFVHFTLCRLRLPSLLGTEHQKKLLSFNDCDKCFKIMPDYRTSTPATQSVSGTKDCVLIEHSSFNQNNSTNYGETTNDVFLSCQEKQLRPYNKEERHSPEEPIFDNSGLQKFMKKLEDETNNMSNINEFGFNDESVICRYAMPAYSRFQTPVYQTAALVDEGMEAESKHEKFSIRNKQGKCDVFAKILTQYVGNLRIWMAATILNRLAKEFESIDESLKIHGILDNQIGNIALEILKKIVENEQFVNAFMPKLPLIVPFLEISNNQQYLVQRIKDLSKGSCIAEYRWDSGAEYHGLRWDERLPTDAAILFHLFCVYMDSQLVPLPQGGGRPFFSRYVIVGDDKRSIKDTLSLVQNKSGCAILCTNILQPKFNFISDGEIHACSYDCYNLFLVIIEFIIFIRSRHNGYLEGVHLGKSGINLMCILDN